MSTPRVSCVLAGSDAELLAAVEAQTRPADDIVYAPTLAEAVARASGDWLWALDGTVVPDPSCLDGLLAATARAPDGRAFASSVLGPDGRPATAWSPWFRTAPPEEAMDSISDGLVPIRAACGAVLVRRAPTLEGPRARLGHGGAVLEWTARLLRGARGYWTRQGTSVLTSTAPVRPVDRRTAAALVGGSAFGGTDRLRTLIDLAAALRGERHGR